ncbi:MAG: DUF1598 domain-containing protein [Pirellulales bacterium]|nr:DUF1598 domain-containing protein [Pirellulales bacterium]
MLRKSYPVWFLVLGLFLSGAWQTTVYGQYYYPQAVGGVSINAQGILENAQPDMVGKLAKLWAETLQPVPREMKELVELRKISLRSLDAALQECAQQKKPVPDDLQFLGGLQQIRYVFVYPERHDIVLVGPGEGWKVDARGNAVGVTTGRPVMLLDDLLVALRSAREAAQGGILCSIEPTPEGLANYQKNSRLLRGMAGNFPALKKNIENLLGMQQIKISGVPPTSHFARVLVAADYRMKRLGMNFEPAPPTVKLPSYLEMLPGKTRGVLTPRFWLEPKYEPLLRDADGLAWEFRGAGVRALTEDNLFTSIGVQKQPGRKNPTAQRWAETMTRQYPVLAVADPIFGELQNCMELAVFAALVVKERLPEKAGQSLPTLMSDAEFKTPQWPAPKQVATCVSMVRKSGGTLVSASGGVAINSWGIADKTEQSAALEPLRAKAAPTNESTWWWN